MAPRRERMAHPPSVIAGPEGHGPFLAEADAGRVLSDASGLFAACHWRRHVGRLAAADAVRSVAGEGLVLLRQASY
jgi:hypothetical protein